MCSDDFRRIITPLFALVSILKHGTLVEARTEIEKAFDGCLRPILRPNWRTEWNEAATANSQRFYWSHFPIAIARNHKERSSVLDLLASLWRFHEQPNPGHRELAAESLAACVRLTGQSVSQLSEGHAARSRLRQNKSAGTGATATKPAKDKIISALTEHHEYEQNGSCGNHDHIGVRELARRAEVGAATVSDFFNREFNEGKPGGHAKYKIACRQRGRLVDYLKVLRGEYPPSQLFKRLSDEQLMQIRAADN